MIELFASSLKSPFSDEDMANGMKFLSSESINRLKRFRFKEDTLRSLLGELLIRQWCHTHYGLAQKEIVICRNNFSKPYIQGLGIDYSIAHSGDWGLCAVSPSGKSIGIDIEQIKNVDVSIAENCFSAEELSAMHKLSAEARINFFYMLWTLKEAYVKYLGTGLQTPLKRFSFEVTAQGVRFHDPARNTAPHFFRYFLDPEYACALCCEAKEVPSEIEVIPPRVLLSLL